MRRKDGAEAALDYRMRRKDGAEAALDYRMRRKDGAEAALDYRMRRKDGAEAALDYRMRRKDGAEAGATGDGLEVRPQRIRVVIPAYAGIQWDDVPPEPAPACCKPGAAPYFISHAMERHCSGAGDPCHRAVLPGRVPYPRQTGGRC